MPILQLPPAADARSSGAPLQMALSLPSSPEFGDAFDQVRRDDRGKWDLTVARRDLCLEGGRVTLPPSYEADVPPHLALTPWACSQMCQRLGVPTAYFRRCPTRLQDIQFNYWVRREGREARIEPDGAWLATVKDACPPSPPYLRAPSSDAPERWLLRGRGERLRAALSERYAPLDNRDLLAALAPLLEKRMEVKGFSLTEESLHLRVIDPFLFRDVAKNDRLFVGLHIANSEVGRRSVTIDALVYRLVCANGMIRLVKGRSLLHRRHVGSPSASLAQSLPSAIGEAVAAGAGLLERMTWSARVSLGDAGKAISQLALRWRLSDALRERVEENLSAAPTHEQNSLYGLANAVTSAAQSLPPDERYDLETLAGTLMDGAEPGGGLPGRE